MAAGLVMLRTPRDFAALEGVRGRAHPLVSVRARRNDLGLQRFGIATGRKVGPSVVRNRVRRRIREILRAWAGPADAGWDILVVARPASATATFDDLRLALTGLLGRTTQEGRVVSS
ncbi:MAG: ribonuclease P protein component [Chloroflexota bacterium]